MLQTCPSAVDCRPRTRSHEAVRPLRLRGDAVLGVRPRAAPHCLHQAARHPHHDVIRPVQEVSRNIFVFSGENISLS